MRVGEFQQALGVNSKSWSDFMGQTGPSKGIGSSVFENAWMYFKARELEGLPMPKKPKASKSQSDSGNGKGKENQGVSDQDVEGIKLDGEDEDQVAIYDSCDEIRRKINAHLKLPGVTQASFLKQIAKSFHTESRKIQGKQLTDFRSKKGAVSGNTSSVYYGSYCYFEKLRIKGNKPKTKHRVDMESVHGGKGMDTERLQNRALVFIGQSWSTDALGRFQIN